VRLGGWKDQAQTQWEGVLNASKPMFFIFGWLMERVDKDGQRYCSGKQTRSIGGKRKIRSHKKSGWEEQARNEDRVVGTLVWRFKKVELSCKSRRCSFDEKRNGKRLYSPIALPKGFKRDQDIANTLA